MVSKTQYSPLCKLQSGEYWVLLATLPSTKNKSIFQQWAMFKKQGTSGKGTSGLPDVPDNINGTQSCMCCEAVERTKSGIIFDVF